MKKKINTPVIGNILKKVAPKIGASVIVEPVWGVVCQITFKNGKKTLVPFLVNFNDDWNKIQTICHSMVTNRPIPFPEVDEFIWADYELAKEKLHFTQHEALDKVFNK